MTMALVVVAVLALVLLGVALWLGMGRARLAAEVAAAQSRRESAETERDAARAEVRRLMDLERQVSARLAELGAEKAALTEQLDAAVKAHHADRNHLYEKLETETGALDQRWRAKVDELEKITAERVASVNRERDQIKASLAQFEQKFRDVFGALASDALKASSQQFLTLATQQLEAKRAAVDDLVKPINETLAKTQQKLAVIESAGIELRSETGKLVRALREPHVRGRYGEIQLRRVAELAGMAAYCDFAEQDQTRGPDGAPLRPDMVVKLPSNRAVVVDAKTNIQAYLDAMSAATPDEADRHMERFGRHVAEQVTALARKKYWAQYDGSPEFVVMFVPGDQFIDAALSRQPELLERAAEQGVILASPSTLIGLLRAVAVGYHEQRLAVAAEELRELGKELHERASTAIEHFVKLGSALRQAVDRYNDFAGSYEKRLEPVLRKFEDNGVRSGKELPAAPEIEARVRDLSGQLRLNG